MLKIKQFFKLIIISLLHLSSLFAQDNNIDDLKKNLQNSLNDSIKIIALTDIIQHYLYENTDSTIKYCDEVIKLSTKKGSWMDVANANNLKAISLQMIGEYSEAIQCSKEAIKILENEKQKGGNESIVNKNYIRFHNTIAVTNYCISDFSTAAENYHIALEYANKISDKARMAILLSNLGSLYRDWGNFDLSLKYQKEGYLLAKELGDTVGIVRSVFNIGSTFFDLENYDSAYFYYNNALPITKSINDFSMLIPIYINLSGIYIKRGEINKAEESLALAKKLITNNDFKRAEAFYYLTSGDLFIAKKNYSKAIKQLTKGYFVSDSSGDLKTEQDILIKLHKTYALVGNYQEAYRFSEKEKTITDSIFSDESSRKISEMEVKFEVEKANMKIQKMKVIQQADNQTKLYLKLGVVSLSIIFLMVIYSFFQRRKQNKLEKDLLLSEKEKLDKDIDFRNRQLTSQALMMMQKNNLLSDISESMKNLARKLPQESKHELNLFKRQLKRSIHSDGDWDLFKHYFEEVNTDFFPNLLNINETLTPAELKLSALIKLRFSIKETAALLNNSPDSIKTARYVLRKKLGLQSTDNIYNFLNDI